MRIRGLIRFKFNGGVGGGEEEGSVERSVCFLLRHVTEHSLAVPFLVGTVISGSGTVSLLRPCKVPHLLYYLNAFSNSDDCCPH